MTFPISNAYTYVSIEGIHTYLFIRSSSPNLLGRERFHRWLNLRENLQGDSFPIVVPVAIVTEILQRDAHLVSRFLSRMARGTVVYYTST